MPDESLQLPSGICKNVDIFCLQYICPLVGFVSDAFLVRAVRHSKAPTEPHLHEAYLDWKLGCTCQVAFEILIFLYQFIEIVHGVLGLEVYPVAFLLGILHYLGGGGGERERERGGGAKGCKIKEAKWRDRPEGKAGAAKEVTKKQRAACKKEK